MSKRSPFDVSDYARTYQQLSRCVRILQYLATCRRMPTLEALASHFEVTKRTVHRDLLAMRGLGVPLPEVPPETDIDVRPALRSLGIEPPLRAEMS